MTTLVAPDAGPEVGARPVTVGAGTKVKVPTDVAVPPIVVTLTVTAPEPAAVVAVICVAEFTVKLAAAVAPNFTAVAPVKLVPVMTTLVPPVAGPEVGARPVMVGAGMKVKVPTDVAVPPIVVTLTVTAPVPAAVVAVIWVAELTVKLAAAVAPVKLVPVMTTLVPPVSGPDVGTSPVTVGAGMNVNVPTDVPVPLAVVTLTLTAPVPAAVVAVIWVAEFTVKLAAAVAPNLTALAPVKFVPVMATLVPPASGPDVGAKLVTVGAGTNENVPTDDAVPPIVVTLTVTAPTPAAVTAVIC